MSNKYDGLQSITSNFTNNKVNFEKLQDYQLFENLQLQSVCQSTSSLSIRFFICICCVITSFNVWSGSFLFSLSLVTVPTVSWILINYAFFSLSWAQLFEGRLALHPGLNLTQLSFSLLKSIFSDNFLCYPIINLLTERINLNLLFKPSNLNSNFALTLGYLNPALNKTALVFNTKV